MRVIVTHDPLDAFSIADRVMVIEAGHVVQSGTVEDVAAHPRTSYVAELIGVNLYRGNVEGDLLRLSNGTSEVSVVGVAAGATMAVIHPRNVTISTDEPVGSARNHWLGTVSDLDTLGEVVRLRLVSASGFVIVAEITTRSAVLLALQVGGQAWASVKATEVVCSSA
jgi:molybdate transport system ATP-binding protein